MNDFCLPIDFDCMKSKSEDSFKKLVKVKAYKYALYIFNSMKGSKIQKTFHAKLVMQQYLKNYSVNDGKLIFSYKTRMSNFSENFHGNSEPKQCPLCYIHHDNQQMAFTCPSIKPQQYINGKYEDMFKTDVPLETVKNL